MRQQQDGPRVTTFGPVKVVEGAGGIQVCADIHPREADERARLRLAKSLRRAADHVEPAFKPMSSAEIAKVMRKAAKQEKLSAVPQGYVGATGKGNQKPRWLARLQALRCKPSGHTGAPPQGYVGAR